MHLNQTPTWGGAGGCKPQILQNNPGANTATLQTYCDEAVKAYVIENLKPRYQVCAGHQRCVGLGLWVLPGLLSGRLRVLRVLAGAALQAAAWGLHVTLPCCAATGAPAAAAAPPRPCRMCRTPATTTSWPGSCGTTPSARQTTCLRWGQGGAPGGPGWHCQRLLQGLCLHPAPIPCKLWTLTQPLPALFLSRPQVLLGQKTIEYECISADAGLDPPAPGAGTGGGAGPHLPWRQVWRALNRGDLKLKAQVGHGVAPAAA